MNAPIDTSITLSGGKFYAGRETVSYMLPFSVTDLFRALGILLALFGLLR
jgi:hypothetical protein